MFDIKRRRVYLDNFLSEYEYSDKAKKDIADCFCLMTTDKKSLDCLKNIAEEYRKDYDFDLNKVNFSNFSGTGKDEYILALTLLIVLSEELLYHYNAENIDGEIYKNTVRDLKYKQVECELVYKKTGTFVYSWLTGHYKLQRFGMGRLQFEVRPFLRNASVGDLVLDEDFKVVSVHIPRTGERLDKESVDKSYALAEKFFKNRYGLEKVVFACHSWLFFHATREFIGEKSNLYKFIGDYTVFSEDEDDNYSEMWRLFDTEIKDIESLPEDTSLRKAYKNYMLSGKKTGCGYGLFPYKK